MNVHNHQVIMPLLCHCCPQVVLEVVESTEGPLRCRISCWHYKYQLQEVSDLRKKREACQGESDRKYHFRSKF